MILYHISDTLQLGETMSQDYKKNGTFEAFHPELVVHPFDGTDYEELHMSIKKIPIPHRERLIKKFFHGMTIIEIAEEEGTTKQAVSKSINKALAFLKKSLQNG